jgi:hypothetical protein
VLGLGKSEGRSTLVVVPSYPEAVGAGQATRTAGALEAAGWACPATRKAATDPVRLVKPVLAGTSPVVQVVGQETTAVTVAQVVGEGPGAADLADSGVPVGRIGTERAADAAVGREEEPGAGKVGAQVEELLPTRTRVVVGSPIGGLHGPRPGPDSDLVVPRWVFGSRHWL